MHFATPREKQHPSSVLSLRQSLNNRQFERQPQLLFRHNYPRRSRSAIGVDIVFTLDVCMFVCMLAL